MTRLLPGHAFLRRAGIHSVLKQLAEVHKVVGWYMRPSMHPCHEQMHYVTLRLSESYMKLAISNRIFPFSNLSTIFYASRWIVLILYWSYVFRIADSRSLPLLLCMKGENIKYDSCKEIVVWCSLLGEVDKYNKSF